MIPFGRIVLHNTHKRVNLSSQILAAKPKLYRKQVLRNLNRVVILRKDLSSNLRSIRILKDKRRGQIP